MPAKFAGRLSGFVFEGSAEAVLTFKTTAYADIFYRVAGSDQIKSGQIDSRGQNIAVGGIAGFFFEFPQKIIGT